MSALGRKLPLGTTDQRRSVGHRPLAQVVKPFGPRSPFSTPLDNLSIDDLGVLRSVHEGWYIEYKEVVPKPQAIAKSVSAFANTFGGFLFYGIQEKSKTENVAGEFPGIDTEQIESELERIRQAICAHSAPEPYFRIRHFPGPSEVLGLGENRSIICVHVPRSNEAPHIHKSGAIYRRVADSSEPTPENDRYALAELFKRSEQLLEKYRHWYEDDPKFHHESEKTQPYLRLLIAFDPWRERQPFLDLTTHQIRKVFNPDNSVATLPFDSIHPMRSGFIARQTTGNGINSLTLTWALRHDLTSEILIPIPCIRSNSEQDPPIELMGYEQANKFIQLLQRNRYQSLTVLDINQLFPVLNGIFETLERIAVAVNWEHAISATYKLLKSNRTCSFLDIEHVIDQFGDHGIPIAIGLMSSLGEPHHPDHFIAFKRADEEGRILSTWVKAGILTAYVVSSLGIPMWEDESDLDRDLIGSMLAAGKRSQEVQRHRNSMGSGN